MLEPSQLLLILSVICFCALVANRLSVAPPIVFLLGGILLGVIPEMGRVTINPEYMLVIFLPPILMEAAFFTSIRDFRASLRPILYLAVGLVLFTAAATAYAVVGLMPGATLALGFVLGAIISPPDAAAATAALKNIQMPKRILTILEGESLVNDATGIVLFKFAVAAVIAGSFSLADASTDFAWKAVGGIAIGLAVAWLFVKLYPFLRDPSAEIISTFVPPYGAYMLAEHVHGSGVLAVVAAGFYIGWHGPTLFNARARMQTEAIWKMAVYFLSALAFLLIGLQLPYLIDAMRKYDPAFVAKITMVICVIALVVRFAYVFAATYLSYWLYGKRYRGDASPPWQNIIIIGWTGMRGVVTLALALALPLTLHNGEPFPYRDLIIFISTSMILLTLVLQGLTLPWLTRRLTLRYDDSRMQEEWLARINSTRKAIATLEHITNCEEVHRPALERIRAHYEERLESLGDGPNTPIHPGQSQSLLHHPLIIGENRIWHEALKTERHTVIELRHSFNISDDVMHDLLQEIDLMSRRFHYTGDPAEENPERQYFWQRLRQRGVA